MSCAGFKFLDSNNLSVSLLDPVCGYHVADFPSGSFGSNDVDEADFYAVVSCVWTISSTITNSTQVIELFVSGIDIPEQETCENDKLEVPTGFEMIVSGIHYVNTPIQIY